MVKNIVFFFLIVRASSSQLLSLKDLIDSAIVNNPEINAAKSKYESVLKRIPGLRYLPDPWFAVEFTDDMQMYSISQGILFPTKLMTRTRYARTEAEEILSDYYVVVNNVLKQIKEGYARLYLTQKEFEIIAQQKNVLEQILTIANHNYRINRVSQVDVIQSHVALTKLENDLLDLANEKIILMAELNKLINRPVDSKLEINLKALNEPSIPEPDSLYQLAMVHSPMLKSYKIREIKTKTDLSLSKQEYLPDFMLKYEWERMDLKNYKIMLGMKVPLWFWQKQNNMVAEMESEFRMAQAEYEAMLNEVLKMVKEKMLILENYSRKIKLYENSIIPQLESALKSAMVAYEINRVDIMTVLETQRMLLEENIAYQQARINYATTVFELEEITGTKFSQN